MEIRAHGLPLLLLSLLLGGCKTTPPDPAPPAQRIARDTWFCEMGDERNEDWRCIESEAVKKSEGTYTFTDVSAPTSSPPSNMDAAHPDHPTTQVLPTGAAGSSSVRVPVVERPSSVEKSPSEEQPNARLSPSDLQTPTGPKRIAIIDLPPEYWTIQIIALSTREAIQEFATKHQLHGYSAAEIRINEKNLYVLLNGVYSTRAEAQAMLPMLPGSLRKQGVWIRQLSSLQDAMRAAM